MNYFPSYSYTHRQWLHTIKHFIYNRINLQHLKFDEWINVCNLSLHRLMTGSQIKKKADNFYNIREQYSIATVSPILPTFVTIHCNCIIISSDIWLRLKNCYLTMYINYIQLLTYYSFAYTNSWFPSEYLTDNILLIKLQ